MPIDDALEKIVVKETDGKKEGDSNGDAEKNSELMIRRANEAMGKVLVNYFMGDLPGQSVRYVLDDKYAELLRKCGMNLLSIMPSKSNGSRSLRHCPSALSLNPEGIECFFKSLFGEYILKTDILKKLEEGIQKGDYVAENLIPDLKAFNATLILHHNTDLFKGTYLATLHPYIIVMGMNLRYRPLATIAVEKAIKNNRINLLTEKLPQQKDLNESHLKQRIAGMMPFTNDYLEVAQEYGITEVAFAMKDFNRVCEEYIKNWV